MARRIRIRAIRRNDIDIEKLAHALLRLARDLQKPPRSEARKTSGVRHE